MKIKDILRSDKTFLHYRIEVNGELYDERKHGDMIHVDTDTTITKRYNAYFNMYYYASTIKFTAIENG